MILGWSNRIKEFETSRTFSIVLVYARIQPVRRQYLLANGILN